MEWKRGYLKFDAVDSMFSVRDVVCYARKQYASSIAYQQIENRAYESAITFQGLADNIDAMGTAMLQHGMQGKHIALLGETSIEWLTCYYAILNGVGVAVPIDALLNAETMVKQLNFGDVEVLVCSKRLLRKAKEVLPYCPRIKTVLVMRTEEVQEFLTVEETLQFSALLAEGAALVKAGDKSYTQGPLDIDALCELVFTSGTTGANKGVMLNHRNLSGVLRGARHLVHNLPTSMSVLPVNHTYELSCHVLAGMLEGTTIYINDDLKHVIQNIGHFAPQMTCMVPMMLNLIVRKIKIESERTGLSKYLAYGIWFSNLLRRIGIDRRQKYFRPILRNFGGNLHKIICGGAPLAQETIDYLDGIGITVLNGYGITECAPLVSVNGDKLHRRGSVGQVLPTCRVRIDNPDENGNGEIQVQGDVVMMGYYKLPQDTASVFTADGWFRTGDIGYLDRKGFLYISGRLKNLIILSNGKNIYPEEVEEALLQEIAYVRECVVYADEAGTGIYAMCYLDEEFCTAHALQTPQQRLDRLRADLRVLNNKLPSYKRIADVTLRDCEFEKTSTRKIKRFTVVPNAAGKKN